ncbi:uncharacterized protein VTP21DRAFT_8596 [Calcarisporiella thermophila]|uniref:uncharacterized protein n=1 Tax=Calcarisporiella thermophila TaxID=911321 RepID=UPI0037431ED2
MKFAISEGELAINLASIVCATLIMILVAFLRYTQPLATCSISFRLSFWIGLADALYRSLYVVWAERDFCDAVIPNNLWFGRIILWSYYFFPMWFSLLTVSIAFDLHLSAFHKHLNVASFQRWYLPLSTLVSFAFSSPLLFYGNLLYNSKLKILILNWPYEIELANTVLVSVVVFACILYSFTVIFACAIKVFTTISRERREVDLRGEQYRLRERLVMTSMIRLLGYPLVLIICLPAECILLLLYVTKSRNTSFGDSTGKAKAILTGLQGVFNLVIFFFNPTFSSAIREFSFNKSKGPQSKSQSISYASTKLDGGDTLAHLDSWMQNKPGCTSTPNNEVTSSSLARRVRFMDVLRTPEREETILPEQLAQLNTNHNTTTKPGQQQFVFSTEDLPDSSIDDGGNKWMLGRRFCASPGIHYILPNDEEELDRLISQHYFFRTLFGNRNFLSPVHAFLQDGAKVLDAGCGPGTWTMEMATEYPNSQFYGIDIYNMFPNHIKPVNCIFQIVNILKRLPFEDNEFDFVYIRHMSFGIFQGEWPEVIGEVVRILKPGGYVELVDADYSIQCEEGALRKLADGIYNTLRARDIHPSWTNRVGGYLEIIGAQDVHSLIQSFPVGKHSYRDGSSGLEQWMQFLSAMKPHLAQVMFLSPEEYDELLRNVYQELGMSGITIDVVCTYGRKPLRIDQAVEDDEQIELQPDKREAGII